MTKKISEEQIEKGLLFKFPFYKAPWTLANPNNIGLEITEFEDYYGRRHTLSYPHSPLVCVRKVEGEKVYVCIRCRMYILTKQYIADYGTLYIQNDV